MKTTVLMAAVLLISTASFSQTTLKTTESTYVNATAGADLKTGAVTKTTKIAKQTTKQTANDVNAGKQTVKDDAKGDVKQITKPTKQNGQVSASSQTSVSSVASLKHNNSGKETSLNGQASLSANEDGNTSTNLKKDGKTALQTSVKKMETETKETDAKVSTKANTVTGSPKPKPVFVKMNTHVVMASTIKIK